MTLTTRAIATALAFLTGIGMIFLGTRFLVSPETAEAGFGIHFNQQGDNAFHYIKGIRDIFSGIVLCVLVILKERRALAVALLAGTIIPVADMLIVLSKDYNGITQAIPHISAIVICFVSGAILLFTKTPQFPSADLPIRNAH